jgi:hypothetical protein
MTRLEAAWLYRRDIAQAVSCYDRRRRDAEKRFVGNSDAIQGAFCNAWGTCRVMFAMADIMLEKRRLDCVPEDVAALNSRLTEQTRAADQWRRDCLTWRGF